MQNKKKKQPCSRLRSFYQTCRRNLPCSNTSSTTNLAINPTKLSLAPTHVQRPVTNGPLVHGNHPAVRREGQLLRFNELEKKLEELEEWLCAELARLHSHIGSASNNNERDKCDRTFKSNNFEMANKTMRLDIDGGYLCSLHGQKILHGVLEDLSVHFSSPALLPLENSSISEVLSKMADMGKEKLVNWLLESMPMTDISTNNFTPTSSLSPCNTPNNFLEAIFFNASTKLKDLAIQGLYIQMGAKEVVKWQQEAIQGKSKPRKEKTDRAEGEAPMIMAMLIQPRDPHRGYKPVYEMIIGLVEATNNAEEVQTQNGGFVIKGVHVAGLVARRRNGQVINNCLWCVSG